MGDETPPLQSGFCIEQFSKPSRGLARVWWPICRIGRQNESPRPRGQLPRGPRRWFSRHFQQGAGRAV